MLLSVIGRLFGRQRSDDSRDTEGARGVDLSQLADEELMLRFADGEHAAFELLLQRHEGPLFRFVKRYVGSPTLAEDLVQEAFLRVCKSAHRYTKKAKFTTWLYTIARNLCIDHLRRGRNKTEVSIDRANGPDSEGDDERSLLQTLADDDARMASSTVLRAEFAAKLEEALAALPDEQREVFTLRQFGGLKFREIGDIVGISENTVKSRMRYALEALRGHLASYRDFSFDADELADSRHVR